MQKFKKISHWVIPAMIVFLPILVFSQFVPTVITPGQEITLGEVEGLIETVARFLVVISVIVAVIVIILGGIMLMMARGNEEAAEKAKNTLKYGVIGALVVLGVGVILQTLAGVVARNFFGGI